MTVGIRIENEGGGIQVNDQLIAWGQSGTGTIVMTDDGMPHPQPIVAGEISVSGGFPVIAIRPRGGKWVGIDIVATKSGGGYTYRLKSQSTTPVTVDWWAFDSAAQATKDPTMQTVNLLVKDEFGVVTFDASMPQLRVVGSMTPGMPTAPMGTDQSSYASHQVPSGRSHAVIISTLGHISTNYDTGNFTSGSPSVPPDVPITEPEDPDAGPPVGATWREQMIESYLGMVSFNGLTFTAGMHKFETWRGWYPMDAVERLTKNGSPSFTVIDVTGYGGGTGVGGPTITVNLNNFTPSATGAAGSDIISPAVTATASGGVGSYTYQWFYDSGSTMVVPHTLETANPFQLRSPATPAGATRETYWRVRATDSQGNVGWSEPAKFTFTAASVDYVPDAITPYGRFDVSSNANDASWNGDYRQITGINQPITLRVERYDYVGNMDALYIDVYTAPTTGGPWTHHGTITANAAGLAYLDVVVANGTWLAYNARAITNSGRRTANCTLVVWNLSNPGGSTQLSNVANNSFVVDADDNYNNADYVPDAVNWNNMSGSSNDGSFFQGHANQTISGINQTITLRATISNVSASNIYLAGSRLDFWKNEAKAHDTSGIGNGYWTETTFTNGDYGGFIAHVVQNAVGVGTLSYTVTITNQSAGGAVLDTFTVNQTVDADYVAPDYTPNAISLTNQSVVTNDWQGYTPGTFFQITGINQPITIRITRGTTTDAGYPAGGTRRLIIGKSTNGGASYVETNMGALSAPLDFTANNGDWFFLKGYFDTAMGTGSSSWTTTVTNATTGADMGSITVSGTVDADNNHNVADPTPNAISVGTLSLVTNEPTGVTSASFFQITGINQAITLRFTRDSLNQTGNAFTRRAMIFHSTTGSGGPWTQYDLGAAAGASIDIATNNGDWFYVQGYLDTTAGKATASWWNYITNITTGQQLASFFINATVDNDNNYNVTPLAVNVANNYSYVNQFMGSGQFYSMSASPDATISGGLAPYTSKWTHIFGDAITVSNLNVLNPTFSFNGTTSWSIYSEYQLLVTDALGAQVTAGFVADWKAGDQA